MKIVNDSERPILEMNSFQPSFFVFQKNSELYWFLKEISI